MAHLCVRIQFGKFSTSHQMDPKFIAITFRQQYDSLAFSHIFIYAAAAAAAATVPTHSEHRAQNRKFSFVLYFVLQCIWTELSAGDESIWLVSYYIRNKHLTWKMITQWDSVVVTMVGSSNAIRKMFLIETLTTVSVCQHSAILLTKRAVQLLLAGRRWTHLRN